jgi:hypothetical protein
MIIRRCDARDTELLSDLFAHLDTTFFRPHDMTGVGARLVAEHAGRDAYLLGLLDDLPVAYGMLRGGTRASPRQVSVWPSGTGTEAADSGAR